MSLAVGEIAQAFDLAQGSMNTRESGRSISDTNG
jgi:hypothetical protein